MNKSDIENMFIKSYILQEIKYSNIHFLVRSLHKLSSIPKIGECVNEQKVLNVNYHIEGQIQYVKLELEPEIRTNEHLSFDEAKTFINRHVVTASGRLPQSPHGDFHSIYDKQILGKVFGLEGQQNSKRFIKSDEFNRLFPKVEILDHEKAPNEPMRRSFWKFPLDRHIRR